MAIRITIVEDTALGVDNIGVGVTVPRKAKIAVVSGFSVVSSIRTFDALNDTPTTKQANSFVVSDTNANELIYVKPKLTQGTGIKITNPFILDDPTIEVDIAGTAEETVVDPSDSLLIETSGGKKKMSRQNFLDGMVYSVFTRTGNVTAAAGDYSSNLISHTPSGSIIATNVDTAIQELDGGIITINGDIVAINNNITNITDGTTPVGDANKLGGSLASKYLQRDIQESISSRYSFTNTDSIKIPVGTEAQRGVEEAGSFRLNSETKKAELYNGDEWVGVGGGGGASEYKIHNSGTSLAIGRGESYMVDTTTIASDVTVNLPLNASGLKFGDWISIGFYADATNDIIVHSDEHPIMGVVGDYTLSSNDSVYTFSYVDATQGWKIVNSVGGVKADEVFYDNTDSGLTADSVKTAIDEVQSNVDTLDSETAKLVGQNTFTDVQRLTGASPILELNATSDGNLPYISWTDSRWNNSNNNYRLQLNSSNGFMELSSNVTGNSTIPFRVHSDGTIAMSSNGTSTPFIEQHRVGVGYIRQQFEADSIIGWYTSPDGSTWYRPLAVSCVSDTAYTRNLQNTGTFTNYGNRIELQSVDTPRLEFHNPGSVAGMFVQFAQEIQYGDSNGSGGLNHYVMALRNVTREAQFAAAVYAVGGFHTGSDIRLKKDIKPHSFGSAINTIKKLEVKEFRYKTDLPSSEKRIGFIAQEADLVLPEAIRESNANKTSDDESGNFLSVDPMAFIALQTEAIKELANRLEKLEKQLNE
ncbi:coil containing protein [Vibrio phage 3.058.O._10N.286.46.B8]|nr:coil containing protein [Vibrio phage 2.058.O._10N.286.46.B8]AUS03091.1 coil containing protein [Vibrio phage 3.058.O._10N.286.46.B8]